MSADVVGELSLLGAGPPGAICPGHRGRARCRRCGEANREHARFCQGCGRTLTAAPAASRRLVTALYCDIVGSTSLAERLDVEALHVALDAFFTTVTAVVHAHQGRVEKFAGDAVLAIFGLPHAAEDDATRAVMAALEMQRSLRDVGGQLRTRLGIELDARIGVASGEAAVLGMLAGESLSIVGDVMNVAARLQVAAQPGEVLITETTRQLVRPSILTEPIGKLCLKGKTIDVTAHRVLRPARPQDLVRSDPLGLVGRSQEVSALEAAIAAAQHGSASQLVVVRGEAGIGKSALIEHVVRRQADHSTVLRCSGRSLGEVVRAARHVMADAATSRPLVIVVEDLHVGGVAMRTALDQALRAAAGLPICLLTSCRHALDRLLPAHAQPATEVSLGALRPTDSTELVRRLLPDDAATHDVAELVRRADGNPLFLLELAREAADLGRVPDRPPAVIQTLVAASLDRLRPTDRQTLSTAAVIGERFSADELAAALGVAAVPDLTQLAMLNLIAAHPSGWRFTHTLVREEIYEQMPRLARAEVHDRLACHSARIGDAEAEIRHLAAACRSRGTLEASGSGATHATREPQDAVLSGSSRTL